jgi:bile acid-coenzyme A ligase
MNTAPAELKPIGQNLSELAVEQPEAPAITYHGRTTTRWELDARSNRLARAYAELGVREGDLVSIMVPNSLEWYEAAIAAWKLGAIPQPLSPRLPAKERDQVLAVAPRALVVGLPDGEVACPSVPLGFEPDPSLSAEPLPPAVSPAYKAATSGGSTGVPKLILAGSSSVLPRETGKAFFLEPGDTQLIAGPLYHNTYLTLSALGLLLGHHLVVMPKFDAAEALALIKHHRVTFFASVPTMLHRMLDVIDKDPDAADFSSIRILWHMAAPCPIWLKERWIELVGPERLWELYGGTELQALTFINGTEWLTHKGSVGKVVSGEMCVFDEDGKPCPAGEIGEIYLRPTPGSPATYRYIGATPRTIGDWDSLGDMGHFDAEGYLYLSDRRTDMILIGGRNVYPAEVEASLMEHPAVRTCAVVGLPHDDLGQVPHAVVDVKPGVSASAEELQRHLAERLVSYKVPRSYDFVDEPLRDDAGKVRRSRVRDEALARRGLAHQP